MISGAGWGPVKGFIHIVFSHDPLTEHVVTFRKTPMTSALPRPSDPVTPWPNIAKALGPSRCVRHRVLATFFLNSIIIQRRWWFIVPRFFLSLEFIQPQFCVASPQYSWANELLDHVYIN